MSELRGMYLLNGYLYVVYDSNKSFQPVNTWPAMNDNPEFLLSVGG